MKTWKKAGLTALAGSMVALSAQAVEVSLSGTMKMTYTADSGAQDVSTDGNRFGMSKAISAAGSGEMDNGWVVSLSNNSFGGSVSSLAIDMGDAGTLTYQQVSGGLGIGKIDDMMPTADEEVWNGMETDATGLVSGGNDGFQYDLTAGEVSLGVGYEPKGGGTQADGANGGTGSSSSLSYTLKFSPMDGLNIGAGIGDKGTSTGAEDEHQTYYATYAIGSFTVGYQDSEIDYAGTTADEDSTGMSVSFAVNDNLSISYGSHETDQGGTTVTEEVDGVSIGYSMGGMTIKAHKNKGDNLGNAATTSSEHTEIALSWAF
jgi:outer membrane protein OmpU